MRDALGLIFWLVLSLGAGALGGQFAPGEAYALLQKPALTPPAWIFAPVWITLYILMAVAAWWIWRRSGFLGARGALTLFIAQLIANALWSWIFFGLQRRGWALVDLAVLDILLVATIVMFYRETWVAGTLLLPYLLWTSFATYLNIAFLRLNP